MQRIAALIGGPAVQALGLMAVSTALGLSDLALKLAIAARLEPLVATGDGGMAASEVDACHEARDRSFLPVNDYG
jgi:hypothetical protein